MRTKRFALFILMICVGLTGGLLYGWVLNPVQFEDTSPDMLRADYKADFVLMVAEIYSADQDIEAAKERLRMLSSQTPLFTVVQGISYGRELNYPLADLDLMSQMAQALQEGEATLP
jgi:hypothetical protein